MKELGDDDVEEVIEVRVKLQGEITLLQATIAKAQQPYGENLSLDYIKKFDTDLEGGNTVVNLTSELVTAGKANNCQVKKIVHVLKNNKAKVNNAVKKLKTRMRKAATEKKKAEVTDEKICNGEESSSTGQYQEKDNLSAK